MRISLVSLSLAIALSSDGAAIAGPAIAFKAALDNCQNANVEFSARIEACTNLIHTNLFAGKLLADLYFIRGNIFLQNHKNDEALSDYNKALELKPDFPQALANRAALESQSALHEAPGTASTEPATAGEKTAPLE
jgi:tetratricopeptide (TPR) repeat protein